MKTFLQANKFGGSFSHSWHFAQYFAECVGGFGSLPQGKRNKSRRELMHRRFERQIAPCKGIRISGSEKFLLLESEIREIQFACRTEFLGVWTPKFSSRYPEFRKPLESGIQVPVTRNPESMAWSPECSPEFPYMGRGRRQPEVGLFPSNMPWRYHICIFKCLFSYRDKFLEDLGKLHSSKVHKDYFRLPSVAQKRLFLTSLVMIFCFNVATSHKLCEKKIIYSKARSTVVHFSTLNQ